MATVPQVHLNVHNVDQAARDFEAHGCLLLSEFIPVELVAALRKRFLEDYEARLDEVPCQKVGDQRWMIPLQIENEFSDPCLFGAPEFLELLQGLLGEGLVLDSFSCINAAPGAEVQHRHRDYGRLFPNALEFFGPSYALNVFIPLVDLNETTGTTRLWPGTHRKPVEIETVTDDESVDTNVPAGSALMFDYRLLHEGLANRSDASRPVLCLAFVRSWFLDVVHFRGLKRLNISRERLLQFDTAQQELFIRADGAKGA